MSYLAGILGSYPAIYCDSPGCDVKLMVDGQLPPAWFLANRPRRGWWLYRRYRPDSSLQRIDYCPNHKHLAVDAVTHARAPKKARGR